MHVYYILNTYGNDAWESLTDEDEFSTLFYAKIYKYGIAIFQDLVNITSRNLDISICDILKSFGEYFRNQQ